MKLFIKTVLLLIILLGSLVFSFFLIKNRPTAHNLNLTPDGVEFEIKNGDSTFSIANRLYDQSQIRSKFLFKLIVKMLNLNQQLKSGWILINHNSSTLKIIRSIYNGQFITVYFTIPEGLSIDEINQILVDQELVQAGEIEAFFKQPAYLDQLELQKYSHLQGFLFPDTYKIFKGSSLEEIYQIMINNFFSKIDLIYPDYQRLPASKFYQKLILASIIEKEVKNKEEAPIVAGVFQNRLQKNIKLQSCATIQYILGEPKPFLLESDLFIDDPYNTYMYHGLPPGAICNPGVTALNAAFHPSQHDYLFFVVKNPELGTHHFSTSYQEHLAAQKKYKKLTGIF